MAIIKSLISKVLPSSRQKTGEVEDHYAQLDKLRLDHEWINVLITKNDRRYQSLILSIDRENHVLLIDDLYPPEYLEQVQPGDTVQISSQDRLQPVHFFSRVIEHHYREGNRCWRFELPKEIGSNQSRNAFRVYVEKENGLSLDIHHQGELLQGLRIINLSTEGLKFSIDDAEKLLKSHPKFQNCIIYLPDGNAIDCDIHILSSQKNYKPVPHILAGGKLTFHNPQQRVKLQQYLAAVQRRQLRRDDTGY